MTNYDRQWVFYRHFFSFQVNASFRVLDLYGVDIHRQEVLEIANITKHL